MRWMALIFCFTWGLLETHTTQEVLFSTQPLSGCNSGLNIVWQGVVKKNKRNPTSQFHINFHELCMY